MANNPFEALRRTQAEAASMGIKIPNVGEEESGTAKEVKPLNQEQIELKGRYQELMSFMSDRLEHNDLAEFENRARDLVGILPSSRFDVVNDVSERERQVQGLVLEAQEALFKDDTQGFMDAYDKITGETALVIELKNNLSLRVKMRLLKLAESKNFEDFHRFVNWLGCSSKLGIELETIELNPEFLIDKESDVVQELPETTEIKSGHRCGLIVDSLMPDVIDSGFHSPKAVRTIEFMTKNKVASKAELVLNPPYVKAVTEHILGIANIEKRNEEITRFKKINMYPAISAVFLKANA